MNGRKKKFFPVAKPNLSDLERRYLIEAFDSGWISSLGDFICKFEEEFAKFIGVKYALTTSSGTAALHLALEACEIGSVDEVILPDLTFIATANAVRYTGAKPIFVDVEGETLSISPAAIEDSITNRTKAIIPVHLYGFPADMERIMNIADKYNLVVIEDAAEAHGAEFNGKKVGSFGHIGIFSFYGNKIITTGEGGMVVTDNKYLFERMKHLRDHAMDKDKRYWHNEVGFNYRMTNLQAAIGLAQLSRIETFIAKRRSIHKWYSQILDSIKGLRILEERPNTKSVYWMVSLVMSLFTEDSRNAFMSDLRALGIDTRPFFYPISLMPMYKQQTRNPIAYEIYKKGVNLPTYHGLTKEDVKWISEQIIAAVKKYH